jgi:ArsR family transcriptional regulator
VKYNYSEYVPVLKALSDETRLKIIDMLSCGEMCACKILESFNITQPTLSYHMKNLCDSEIVIGRREGSWMYYSLNKDKHNQLLEFLLEISSKKENCICDDCK